MFSLGHVARAALLGAALTSVGMTGAKAGEDVNFTGDVQGFSSLINRSAGDSAVLTDSWSIGQLFTADNSKNILNKFSFYISGEAAKSYSYVAKVFEYNLTTNKTVGSAIFSSAVETAPVAASPDKYVKKTFNVGAASLNGGSTYIAYLTNEGTSSTNDGSTLSVAAVATSPLSAFGRTVGVGGSTVGTWNTPAVNVAFSWEYNDVTAVPVPIAGAGLPMLLGAAGLAALRRRKKAALAA